VTRPSNSDKVRTNIFFFFGRLLPACTMVISYRLLFFSHAYAHTRSQNLYFLFGGERLYLIISPSHKKLPDMRTIPFLKISKEIDIIPYSFIAFATLKITFSKTVLND
jgi:hypothetical protein